MRGFILSAAFLPLLMAPAAWTAAAPAAKQDSEKKEKLDSVIVSTSRADASSPVTYTMVSGRQLRDANPIQSLPMNLNLQPSVVTYNEGGTGLGNSAMTVRGVKGSQINVTLNGITLNDAESQEVFWVNIPALTGLLSSVQLQRGLGTSASGAGAFGASVNMSTASVGVSPSAAVEYTTGSWNTNMASVAASTGLTKSGFYAQFAWSRARTDGYIRNAGVRAQSGFAVLGWMRGANSFRLTYLVGDQHSGITWDGIDPAVYETDRRFNAAGQYTDDGGAIRYYDNQTDNYRQHHLQLNYTRQVTDDLVWTTTADYTRGDGYDEYYKTGRKFAEFGFPSPMRGADGQDYKKSDLIYRKALDNDLYVLKSDMRYRHGGLDLTGGIYFSEYLGNHWGEILWARVLEPAPVVGEMDWKSTIAGARFDYGALNAADAWYRYGGTKWDLSSYLRAEYALSPRWMLYADLQLRNVDYILAGRDDKASTIPMDYHKMWTFFNPRAGVTFLPAAGHKFYASAAVGHREPGRGDIKENIKGEQIPIKPESMLDFEAGYAWTGRTLSASANLYLMEYKDMLLETGRLNSSGYAIKENIGRAWRRGIELAGAWKPSDYFRLDANATLSTNRIKHFTASLENWVDGGYRLEEYDRVNMLLSPSLTGMVALNVKPFAEKRGSLRTTTLSLDGKYVGKQYWDNTENADRCIPAFFVSNLSLSHAFDLRHGQLGLTFYVNNLLNAKYYASAWVYRAWQGAVAEDGSARDPYYLEAGVFPQATRNWMLKVSWRF